MQLCIILYKENLSVMFSFFWIKENKKGRKNQETGERMGQSKQSMREVRIVLVTWSISNVTRAGFQSDYCS